MSTLGKMSPETLCARAAAFFEYSNCCMFKTLLCFISANAEIILSPGASEYHRLMATARSVCWISYLQNGSARLLLSLCPNKSCQFSFVLHVQMQLCLWGRAIWGGAKCCQLKKYFLSVHTSTPPLIVYRSRFETMYI